MTKFRYYIIDTHIDSIRGTNDKSLAAAYARKDACIVLDSQEDLQLVENTGLPIRPFKQIVEMNHDE